MHLFSKIPENLSFLLFQTFYFEIFWWHGYETPNVNIYFIYILYTSYMPTQSVSLGTRLHYFVHFDGDWYEASCRIFSHVLPCWLAKHFEFLKHYGFQIFELGILNLWESSILLCLCFVLNFTIIYMPKWHILGCYILLAFIAFTALSPDCE